MTEEQFGILFKEILNKYSFTEDKKTVTEKNIPLFYSYYCFLIEENKKYNLTSIVDVKQVIEKHFIDSLLAFNLDLIPDGSSVIDVGSGAGFPGVPLAICMKGCSFYLLEPIKKRALFLELLVKRLALTNCIILNERSEILGKETKFREVYDFAVSRAVAPLNVLSELCLPFVKTGGKMLAYKSLSAEEDISIAKKAISVLGGEEPELLGESERNIVSVRKITKTPEQYPRRNGIPQKRPIE